MKKKTADKIIESLQTEYEAIAEHFSETRHSLWPELEALRGEIREGEKILDVGCGNGRLLSLFSDVRIVYAGIDNSAKLLEKAQCASKKFSHIQSTFINADMRSIPYPDRQFDYVFCIASLHHIPSAEYRLQAVKELYRLAKPGAKIFMTNWDVLRQPSYVIDQIKYRLQYPSKFWGLGLKNFLIPWTLPNGKKAWRYYYAFSEKELSRLLEKVGFSQVTFLKSGFGDDFSKKQRRRNIIVTARK
jgi:ubiquinone/menaquinone biosynthesis C-methylase UbiE